MEGASARGRELCVERVYVLSPSFDGFEPRERVEDGVVDGDANVEHPGEKERGGAFYDGFGEPVRCWGRRVRRW